MTNPSTYSVPLIFLLVVMAHWSSAQPGDRQFSVVTFDNNGFATCTANYYTIYACAVQYPNRHIAFGSFELAWKPDLKTLKVNDTLKCTTHHTDSASFPYEAFYTGRSCLATDLLIVIRNNKDTMLISAGGSNYYLWALDPNGYDLALPFIFPFQKGLFYLNRLYADKSRWILHNTVYRDYLLKYYQQNTPGYSPVNNRITKLKMSRPVYHLNDTISIIVNGRLLNNGACAGGSILWTLQQFANNKWVTQQDECCTQMDCGVGHTIANHAAIPVFIERDSVTAGKATYPVQLSVPKAKYRLVVYDDNHRPYWTNEFIIE